MIRLGLLFVLCGCGEDKHSLPAIKAATEDPVKPPLPTPTVDTSTISGRLKSLFGATQSPDLSGSIEKLEAQRATMSEPERKLIDRTIALMRTGEAAASETDRVKARPLQIQVMRDTIALLADMSAIAPDDLDLQAMVAGSFWMTAPNIESMEMADDIPPRPIRQRAKTIAERMTKVHPSAAKAWSMLATFTSYSEPEARLRGWIRCLKLEPINAICKEAFDRESAAYVLPYCEGADIKGDISWRSASKTPTPGSTQVEHHYETIYLAATPQVTIKDVVRVRATTNRADYHQDGKVTTTVRPGILFEIKPATQDAMVAWSRDLEKRGDSRATTQAGKLLFTDPRAMWDDSPPGIVGVEIREFCANTKTRALPKLD